MDWREGFELRGEDELKGELIWERGQVWNALGGMTDIF